MKLGLTRSCGLLATAFAMAFLGACESNGRGTIRGGTHLPGTSYLPNRASENPAVVPQPRPAREQPVGQTPARAPAPVATGSAVMYYPSGERNSSQIMLEQVMPREVVRGAEYAYSYKVTNLTNGVLQNVVVNQLSTQNIDPRSSNPQGAASGGGVMWALGDMGAGETRTITVNAVSGATGTAGNCVTVSFNNSLCATTNVVEPALRLVKEATSTATTCDPIVMRFAVSNPGSGMATGVVIRDQLPEGLLTVEGNSRNIEIAVGNIAAGATETREVRVKASAPGSFNNVATATAAGGLTAESNRTTTTVTKPSYTLTANCSQTQFLGRNICFEYVVRNTGTSVAANTVVTANIPAGTTFVEASTGGTASASTVTFNVGALAAGGSATVRYCVRTNATGTVTSNASVGGNCADAVNATCSTEMRGIPALLLETVDSPDPVEVGTQTTYTVVVTNQGSAVGTNIRIVCTLPAQQAFVAAGGQTTATNSGQTVTFAPLANLAPGAKATWTITIRASDVGDVRFTTVMNSDQLTSPVQETESTNLYR